MVDGERLVVRCGKEEFDDGVQIAEGFLPYKHPKETFIVVSCDECHFRRARLGIPRSGMNLVIRRSASRKPEIHGEGEALPLCKMSSTGHIDIASSCSHAMWFFFRHGTPNVD